MHYYIRIRFRVRQQTLKWEATRSEEVMHTDRKSFAATFAVLSVREVRTMRLD